MPAGVIVLGDIAPNLAFEVRQIIERMGINELILDDLEKGFYFAVGLWVIGRGIPVLNTHLSEEGFNRMIFGSSEL